MGVWVDHLIPQCAKGHVRPLKADKKREVIQLLWSTQMFCYEKGGVFSPEGHRRASPSLVSSNSHRTVATTIERDRLRGQNEVSTESQEQGQNSSLRTTEVLTSPRTRKSELFPHPLGPHTKTLAPDFTFEEQYKMR